MRRSPGRSSRAVRAATGSVREVPRRRLGALDVGDGRRGRALRERVLLLLRRELAPGREEVLDPVERDQLLPEVQPVWWPSSSCSARARPRSGSRSRRTSSSSSRSPGFVLIVFGLAFLGLLPWPDRLVGAGLVQGARRRGSGFLLGGAFAVCAAPCITPVLGSILVLAGDSETVLGGIAAARRVRARSRGAVPDRRGAVRTGDGSLPLAARPLSRDRGRERPRPRRARRPALRRRVLATARLPEPPVRNFGLG